MTDKSETSLLSSAIYATYEYALIVSPVALYVFLESLHSAAVANTFTYSPEWNIATIFLAAQGQSIYRSEAERSGGHRSHAVFGLIALAAIIVIVLAVANIMLAFKEETFWTSLAMWILFFLASVVFLLMITGVRYVTPNQA